jgi:hypothetical protein
MQGSWRRRRVKSQTTALLVPLGASGSAMYEQAAAYDPNYCVEFRPLAEAALRCKIEAVIESRLHSRETAILTSAMIAARIGSGSSAHVSTTSAKCGQLGRACGRAGSYGPTGCGITCCEDIGCDEWPADSL